MKNSIASVWLLGIIITFILLFAAYIAITVNYSTSFRMKNEILDIIEKHRGMTSSSGTNITSVVVEGKTLRGDVGTLQTINLYLLGNAYYAKGYCPSDEYDYGVRELEYETDFGLGGTVVTPLSNSTDGEKFYYCFTASKTAYNSPYNSLFYTVRLFYKFEVPILADILQVKVEGVTNEIYKPNRNDIIVQSVGYNALPLVEFNP